MGSDYMGSCMLSGDWTTQFRMNMKQQQQNALMAVEDKSDRDKENKAIEDDVAETLERHSDPRWRATMYHMLRVDGMNEEKARDIRVRRGMSK